MRFWRLGAHGLWCDEFLSVASATGGSLVTPIRPSAPTFTVEDFWSANSLAGLRQAVARQDGGNGLLHVVALHYWIAAFGTSDASVRALSALAGVGLVVLAYSLARSLLAERVAVGAAALVSLHPMLIRYSREARGYALATLLALAATAVFVQLWQRAPAVLPRDLRGIVYGLLTGAALLSHYLVAAIFAGHVAFALLRVRDARVWKHLAVGWTLAAVMAATWMALGGAEGLRRMTARNDMLRQRVAQQTARRRLPPTVENMGRDLAVVAHRLTGNELDRNARPSLAGQLLLLIPCGLVAAAFVRKPAVGSAGLLLAILALAAPVQAVVLAVGAGHTTALNPRYALFSAPYVLLLMAAGLSKIAALRGVGRALPALALAVLGAVWVRSIRDVWTDAPQFRPPNAHAEGAGRLAGVLQQGDVVVHPHWESARLCALYLPRSANVVQRVESHDDDDDEAPVRILREGRAVFEVDMPRPCPRGVFEVNPRSRAPGGPPGPLAPGARGRGGLP